MRSWWVLPCALLGSAGAVASARAHEPLGSLRLNSDATRYGTSYETVYQLNLQPGATLRLGSLELSALLPLSTSATYPTFCCRLALGNATLALARRSASAGVRHWYEASVSLPSSRWSDPHANSLAATAALLHDAGYYLPNTTTLRAGLGADVDVTHWLSLGASAGANHWLRHEREETDPLIVPLSATATLRWARAWSASVGYRGQLRLLDPLGPADRYLHGVSASTAHAWSDSLLELSLLVPLDRSLLDRGMLSIGTSYVRSF
ncbi:MAG: hypothetical protein ABI895_21610 [Deltaproteobacteria bacterium]